MKMRQEDYAQLEQAVNRVLSEHPEITVQGYTSVGRSAMRFRWDAMRAAIKRGYFPQLHCNDDSLYTYCNDDHIDTALRRITGTKK
jgi:hypothetical protein